MFHVEQLNRIRIMEYHYQNNMHIIDGIINELMIERTAGTEVESYQEAKQLVFLKMFPCVTEQSEIIEKMWDAYEAENSVKEWYESLFHEPIKPY